MRWDIAPHKVFPQLANSSKHACDFPGSQEYVGVFSHLYDIYHSSAFLLSILIILLLNQLLFIFLSSFEIKLTYISFEK